MNPYTKQGITKPALIVGILFVFTLLVGCADNDSSPDDQENTHQEEPSEGGIISGKVSVDGSGVAAQMVVIQGADMLESVETDTDGNFTTAELAEGTYVVSVEVASTQEAQQQAAVTVEGSVQMPPFEFSGLGSIRGSIVDSAGDPLGFAQVDLLGSASSARADAEGKFTFSNIPTGQMTVSASAPGPDSRLLTGNTQVHVKFAREAELTLTLIDENPPEPGFISGRVSFSTPNNLTLIELSIPVLSLSTQADVNGAYTFEVPPGTWEVYAEAPYYPLQKIGEVFVDENQDKSLDDYQLTLYRPLPTFGAHAAQWEAILKDADGKTASLLRFVPSDTADIAYYSFDYDTQDVTPISVGGSEPILSPDGKYAAVESDAGLTIISVGGTESFFVPMTETLYDISFTHTSKMLYVDTKFDNSDLRKIIAITLTTGQSISFANYHEEGLGLARVVRTTHRNIDPRWKRLGPNGVSPVFTNVPALRTGWGNIHNYYPALFGIQNCADTACPLWVLRAEEDTAIQVIGRNFESLDMDQDQAEGEWLVMWEGTTPFLINMIDGSWVEFPAQTSTVLLSHQAQRVVFMTEHNTKLYEAAMPLDDPSTLSPVATSAHGFDGYWASPTRFLGFDNDPTQPKRLEIQAGQLTQDEDYEPNSLNLRYYPVIAWNGQDGALHAVAGDSPVFIELPPAGAQIDWITGEVDVALGADTVESTFGERFVIFWDNGESWFIDDGSRLRVNSMATPGSEWLHNNLLLIGFGAPSHYMFIDFDTGQRIAFEEPWIDDLSLDTTFVNPSTLCIGTGQSSPDSPTSNRYALLPAFSYW